MTNTANSSLSAIPNSSVSTLAWGELATDGTELTSGSGAVAATECYDDERTVMSSIRDFPTGLADMARVVPGGRGP